MSDKIEGKQKKPKGTLSIYIAGVFLVLQLMLILGGLYVERSPHQGSNISFDNGQAIVQSMVYIFFINILGIGALLLSMIVWLRHKNKGGKIIFIISSIVIIINTILSR